MCRPLPADACYALLLSNGGPHLHLLQPSCARETHDAAGHSVVMATLANCGADVRNAPECRMRWLCR
jgi:hypothetical protein